MDSWIVVLVVKLFAVLAIACGYYFTVYKGCKALERVFPAGKLKDFLFRERGRYDGA